MIHDFHTSDRHVLRLGAELSAAVLRDLDAESVLRQAIGGDESLRIIGRIRERVGAGETNQIVERVIAGASETMQRIFTQIADGQKQFIDLYFGEENKP
jgi:hypothetical protein